MKRRVPIMKLRRCRVHPRIRSSLIRLALVAPVLGGLIASQPAIAQSRSRRGADIRASAPAPILNVPYAHTSPLEKLDVYPSADPDSPLVVWVHGGAWAGGDKDKGPAAKAAELQDSGITVFDINYRLDTNRLSAFPMEVQDVNLATKWAIANASSFNANPAKVTQVGSSAGGHLVAMSSEDLNDKHPGTVSGVVTLSGPFDFVSLVQDGLDGTLNQTFAPQVGRALGCALSSCTSSVETAWSPSDHVTATNCPPAGWLMYNSQNELVPVDQPNAMAAALQQHNCKVTKTIFPGTEHAGDYWEAVKADVIAFITAA
jgi:acetyl esterase/lipase